MQQAVLHQSQAILTLGSLRIRQNSIKVNP